MVKLLYFPLFCLVIKTREAKKCYQKSQTPQTKPQPTNHQNVVQITIACELSGTTLGVTAGRHSPWCWNWISYLFLSVENYTVVSLSQKRNTFCTAFSWWLSRNILSQENNHCKGADKNVHNCHIEPETFFSDVKLRRIIFTWTEWQLSTTRAAAKYQKSW